MGVLTDQQVLVSKGRIGETDLYLSDHECNRVHVLRVSHGRDVPPGRRGWIQRLAVVSSRPFCSQLLPTGQTKGGVAADNKSYRLFIVDGIITFPIAIAGFFVLPDLPETTVSLCPEKYLNKLETRPERLE